MESVVVQQVSSFVRDREIKQQKSIIEDLEIELRSLTVNDDDWLSRKEELKDQIASEKKKLCKMKAGNAKYNKMFKRR